MQLNVKLDGTFTPPLLSIQLNLKPYVRMCLWNILYNIFQRRILTYGLIFSWMESKRGVKVPYNLALSCMRKYFTYLNLSSSLFGQCGMTWVYSIEMFISENNILSDNDSWSLENIKIWLYLIKYYPSPQIPTTLENLKITFSIS
jgi:hypothetical protein